MITQFSFFHQMHARSQECFAKGSDFSSLVLSWRFHHLLVISGRGKTAFKSHKCDRLSQLAMVLKPEHLWLSKGSSRLQKRLQDG